MGKARFMAVNMIPTTGISASSIATGYASRAQKEGSGSAVMSVSGTFTGTQNLDYLVQIDAAGTNEIGSAKFKWSDDGGASFDATGVTTSTSPVALNNGLSVSWTQGAGKDVLINDKWRFKGVLPYAPIFVVDRDRDTEWRTAVVSGSPTITFDLGSAKTPKVLILLDHNLTSAATIRLQASTVSNFASTPVNDLVVWRSGSILHYIGDPDRTYRYWRLVLTNTANPDGYLRISEVFLGTYVQLAKSFSLGDVQGRVRAGQRDRSAAGRWYGGLNALLKSFDMAFVRTNATDRDALVGVFEALNSASTRTVLPVFFNPNSEDLSLVYLCEWEEDRSTANSETDSPDTYTLPVRLIEIPRTRA